MNQRNIRTLHRWTAIATALPFACVVLSGILLQLKKEFSWIQPRTLSGSDGGGPLLTLDSLLALSAAVPEADVAGWNDVERIDIRPDKRIAKIRCRNHRELQIDLHSGEVLSSRFRRSDIIESVHDGSFIHPAVKYAVFLPSGIAVFLLWITGLVLAGKRKKRRGSS
ncbi:PepSY domain-containing protein [bacterium]|nr:PepSY domain-containing protein [bacterium]